MSRKDKFLRKCISCGSFLPKEKLIRITKNFVNKEIIINSDNKIFGRSIYICKNNECISDAFKKMKISKFLKCNVSQDVKEKIKTVLEQ